MPSRPTEPFVPPTWPAARRAFSSQLGDRGALVVLVGLLGIGVIGPCAGCSSESPPIAPPIAPADSAADSAAEADAAQPGRPAAAAVATAVEVELEAIPGVEAAAADSGPPGADPLADAGESELPASEAAAESPAVLDRVVAIGASVTAGFGTRVFVRQEQGIVTIPVGLGEAVGAAMPGVGRATTAGDLGFFAAPNEVGRRTLERAVADEATLIVALDWLFWFAYGNTGHVNGTEADIAARERRVAAALQRLEAVETPLVVGDIPDMSAAAGGMLRASQVCPEPARQQLNARIRAWASGRPNVTVVGLSDLAAGLRDGELYGAPEGSALLKQDRLHTTVDGLVVLARAVAEAIDAARDDVGPEHLLKDHRAIIDRLRATPAR